MSRVLRREASIRGRVGSSGLSVARSSRGVAWLLLFLLGMLTACSGGEIRRAPDSLYGDLGGLPGIASIVEGLLFEISEDPRIAQHFADTDILRLREKLIEQLCMESGGPCRYTGDSMQQSHAGRGFTEADFNAMVECLQAAMSAEGVPFGVQNRLLARLAPMQRDILYR